jgi:hypothetical protein
MIKIMFDNKSLLEIQIRALQDSLPEKVDFRGKASDLSKKEKLASGRAIWYVVQKGWGLSSAVTKASGSFGCSPSKVERALKHVFPDDYFANLQTAKNKVFLKELDSGI